MFFDERKAFDIKSSKTWVFLLEMAFLRDLKVVSFEIFMFQITGTKLEKESFNFKKVGLYLFDAIRKTSIEGKNIFQFKICLFHRKGYFVEQQFSLLLTNTSNYTFNLFQNAMSPSSCHVVLPGS